MTRLERRLAIAVVAVGVVVLAGAAVLALRWAEVTAWLDAPGLIEAHTSVAAAPLPPGLVDDATFSACPLGLPVRCAWTDLPPEQAVAAMEGALSPAGLEPGDAACGEQAPPVWGMRRAVCGATATINGAVLAVVATDRTLIGDVPLGRTAVWVQWDMDSMSVPLLDRFLRGVGAYHAAPFDPAAPVDLDALRAVLPDRYRGVIGESCPPEGCLWFGVPLDVADLDAEPVGAVVRELTDHGAFVLQATPDAVGEQVVVSAHRFTDAEAGVNIVVRAGGPTGYTVDVFLF